MKTIVPRGLACLLLAALVLGCGSGSPSDWKVATPEQMGMDSAVLDGARQYAFQDGKNTQGVVVVRGDAIVAEWYADGHDQTSYAASWSVAKSFTSALIGIALDRGLIGDVNVSMADYFPAWSGTPKASITLRDVLSMASGLDWNEDYSGVANSNVVQMVLSEPDELAYASSIPVLVDPGTRFNYSSGDAMLLSGVLEKATGMSAAEFGQEALFDRVDMGPVDWWRDAGGHSLTYCCIDTPTRQFAKFGLLYLHHGKWNGRQVVPSSWVTASTSPSEASSSYGYMWWLIGTASNALPDDTFAALGHDGQYIYVIPSRDLVVVRNGLYYKYDGDPVADPNLFSRYPSDGLASNRGTVPPDAWDHVAFLTPILSSIVN